MAREASISGALPGLVLCTALALAPVWAHQTVDPADVVPGHPTGHVDDRADQTWPPQPRGLRNEVSLSNPETARRTAELRRRQVAARDRLALAEPEVRKALGKRYSPPEVGEPGGKGFSDSGVSRLVYFSHDRNATVEVSVDAAGVRGLRRIPASVYQPDVTDEEIAAAEMIARRHFRQRGRQRVEALSAYGILAHVSQGAGFYPTRMLYLTFHAEDDAPPEFGVWVDLTSQRVVRVREEQP